MERAPNRMLLIIRLPARRLAKTSHKQVFISHVNTAVRSRLSGASHPRKVIRKCPSRAIRTPFLGLIFFPSFQCPRHVNESGYRLTMSIDCEAVNACQAAFSRNLAEARGMDANRTSMSPHALLRHRADDGGSIT